MRNGLTSFVTAPPRDPARIVKEMDDLMSASRYAMMILLLLLLLSLCAQARTPKGIQMPKVSIIGGWSGGLCKA